MSSVTVLQNDAISRTRPGSRKTQLRRNVLSNQPIHISLPIAFFPVTVLESENCPRKRDGAYCFEACVMSCFFQTVSNKYRSRQGSESIIEEQLRQWGLTGKFRAIFPKDGIYRSTYLGSIDKLVCIGGSQGIKLIHREHVFI